MCIDMDHDDFGLGDWPTAPKTIEAIRAIRDNHEAKVIDGVLVDANTANAIVTVHDAISPENQKRMLQCSIVRMSNIAWKAVTPK
jgi:hypothetical protein